MDTIGKGQAVEEEGRMTEGMKRMIEGEDRPIEPGREAHEKDVEVNLEEETVQRSTSPSRGVGESELQTKQSEVEVKEEEEKEEGRGEEQRRTKEEEDDSSERVTDESIFDFLPPIVSPTHPSNIPYPNFFPNFLDQLDNGTDQLERDMKEKFIKERSMKQKTMEKGRREEEEKQRLDLDLRDAMNLPRTLKSPTYRAPTASTTLSHPPLTTMMSRDQGYVRKRMNSHRVERYSHFTEGQTHLTETETHPAGSIRKERSPGGRKDQSTMAGEGVLDFSKEVPGATRMKRWIERRRESRAMEDDPSPPMNAPRGKDPMQHRGGCPLSCTRTAWMPDSPPLGDRLDLLHEPNLFHPSRPSSPLHNTSSPEDSRPSDPERQDLSSSFWPPYPEDDYYTPSPKPSPPLLTVQPVFPSMEKEIHAHPSKAASPPDHEASSPFEEGPSSVGFPDSETNSPSNEPFPDLGDESIPEGTSLPPPLPSEEISNLNERSPPPETSFIPTEHHADHPPYEDHPSQEALGPFPDLVVPQASDEEEEGHHGGLSSLEVSFLDDGSKEPSGMEAFTPEDDTSPFSSMEMVQPPGDSDRGSSDRDTFETKEEGGNGMGQDDTGHSEVGGESYSPLPMDFSFPIANPSNGLESHGAYDEREMEDQDYANGTIEDEQNNNASSHSSSHKGEEEDEDRKVRFDDTSHSKEEEYQVTPDTAWMKEAEQEDVNHTTEQVPSITTTQEASLVRSWRLERLYAMGQVEENGMKKPEEVEEVSSSFSPLDSEFTSPISPKDGQEDLSMEVKYERKLREKKRRRAQSLSLHLATVEAIASGPVSEVGEEDGSMSGDERTGDKDVFVSPPSKRKHRSQTSFVDTESALAQLDSFSPTTLNGSEGRQLDSGEKGESEWVSGLREVISPPTSLGQVIESGGSHDYLGVSIPGDREREDGVERVHSGSTLLSEFGVHSSMSREGTLSGQGQFSPSSYYPHTHPHSKEDPTSHPPTPAFPMSSKNFIDNSSALASMDPFYVAPGGVVSDEHPKNEDNKEEGSGSEIEDGEREGFEELANSIVLEVPDGAKKDEMEEGEARVELQEEEEDHAMENEHEVDDKMDGQADMSDFEETGDTKMAEDTDVPEVPDEREEGMGDHEVPDEINEAAIDEVKEHRVPEEVKQAVMEDQVMQPEEDHPIRDLSFDKSMDIVTSREAEVPMEMDEPMETDATMEGNEAVTDDVSVQLERALDPSDELPAQSDELSVPTAEVSLSLSAMEADSTPSNSMNRETDPASSDAPTRETESSSPIIPTQEVDPTSSNISAVSLDVSPRISLPPPLSPSTTPRDQGELVEGASMLEDQILETDIDIEKEEILKLDYDMDAWERAKKDKLTSGPSGSHSTPTSPTPGLSPTSLNTLPSSSVGAPSRDLVRRRLLKDQARYLRRLERKERKSGRTGMKGIEEEEAGKGSGDKGRMGARAMTLGPRAVPHLSASTSIILGIRPDGTQSDQGSQSDESETETETDEDERAEVKDGGDHLMPSSLGGIFGLIEGTRKESEEATGSSTSPSLSLKATPSPPQVIFGAGVEDREISPIETSFDLSHLTKAPQRRGMEGGEELNPWGDEQGRNAVDDDEEDPNNTPALLGTRHLRQESILQSGAHVWSEKRTYGEEEEKVVSPVSTFPLLPGEIEEGIFPLSEDHRFRKGKEEETKLSGDHGSMEVEEENEFFPRHSSMPPDRSPPKDLGSMGGLSLDLIHPHHHYPPMQHDPSIPFPLTLPASMGRGGGGRPSGRREGISPMMQEGGELANGPILEEESRVEGLLEEEDDAPQRMEEEDEDDVPVGGYENMSGTDLEGYSGTGGPIRGGFPLESYPSAGGSYPEEASFASSGYSHTFSPSHPIRMSLSNGPNVAGPDGQRTRKASFIEANQMDAVGGQGLFPLDTPLMTPQEERFFSPGGYGAGSGMFGGVPLPGSAGGSGSGGSFPPFPGWRPSSRGSSSQLSDLYLEGPVGSGMENEGVIPGNLSLPGGGDMEGGVPPHLGDIREEGEDEWALGGHSGAQESYTFDISAWRASMDSEGQGTRKESTTLGYQSHDLATSGDQKGLRENGGIMEEEEEEGEDEGTLGRARIGRAISPLELMEREDSSEVVSILRKGVEDSDVEFDYERVIDADEEEEETHGVTKVSGLKMDSLGKSDQIMSAMKVSEMGHLSGPTDGPDVSPWLEDAEKKIKYQVWTRQVKLLGMEELESVLSGGDIKTEEEDHLQSMTVKDDMEWNRTLRDWGLDPKGIRILTGSEDSLGWGMVIGDQEGRVILLDKDQVCVCLYRDGRPALIKWRGSGTVDDDSGREASGGTGSVEVSSIRVRPIQAGQGASGHWLVMAGVMANASGGEGHVEGVRILHVDLLTWGLSWVGPLRRDSWEILSGDDQGMVYHHRVGWMGPIKSKKTTRILGRVVKDTASGSKRPTTILGLDSLYDENDEAGLVAILTPYKMIVVKTKGRMETVFRVLRSSIAPSDGIKSGCLAWGNQVEIEGETQPVLAYAWGERLWLLRAFADGDGQVSLAHVGEWTGVSDVVGLRWSGTWLWIWTREGDVVIWSYRAGKAIERIGLSPEQWWSDGGESTEELDLSTLTRWDSKIGPARSIRGSQGGMLGSVLFQCGDHKIWQGSWRSWEDRLGRLIGNGKLLTALEMAVGYAASLPGLDLEGCENSRDRRRIVGIWIMSIVRKVLSLGLQDGGDAEEETATEVQAQAYQLAKYVIQASIHLPVTYIAPGEDEAGEEDEDDEDVEALGLEEMDRFLFEGVYDTFVARHQERAFLEALIPYILSKRKSLGGRGWSLGQGKERWIRQVPPPILASLLQLLHRTGRDVFVEEILNHLEIQAGVGDSDLMLKQARAAHAWSSLLRIWSLGVGDWVGGVAELLERSESLVRVRGAERSRMERVYGPKDVRIPVGGEEDAVMEVERVEGSRVRKEMWGKWERAWASRVDRMVHPLFVYLDKALLGRLGDDGQQGIVRGRTDLYRYLLGGEGQDGEERKTPLVRLMHLDTGKTMSMMERALEDAYLDKKPMAPDNPRPDWVIGQVSRQGILEGILRAVGLYDEGGDDLGGDRRETGDILGQDKKREMSKEERRQKRRSWSISGLAPGQYPLSPTASGQLLGRQGSMEAALEDQGDRWSIQEISHVACMVSRAYSRYHPGIPESNGKENRKSPRKGRVVRWGDEVGASIVSGPTVSAVATASTASKISYVNLGRETLQNIVYALVRDTDPTTHQDRQGALEDLLKVYAPAAPEAMERMYERAGFYRVLESVYRKTHRYGRIVETYLMDTKRRHGVFEALCGHG
ncbi:hypothetical protein BJ684DRAFT_19593 [Piptocephalis cylindrospora]|uniref:Uncharacterized protein n=1 Tax=Piptocephalis cylindrospora TaxID=1907219 RepID=A0A4P9Y7Q1_9FUNG|nr:hypothetical protein BJ684DRAFT_19593 [Piptocephalis cylindrospora]|eukprot:RKP13960.1 hypothetical protein BJ684DRAFT_19593 [Piptocephalis cylindrospora]